MRRWRLAKSSARSALWCLRPFYLCAPGRWSFRLRYLDSRVAVSREHRFIYVRIPKAANTTVVFTLYWMIHGQLPTSGGQAKESFLSPRELSFAQARTASTDYFKFMVVRNPFGRVLSAYLDKIVFDGKPRPPEFKGLVRDCLGLRDGAEIDFETFCRYLKNGGLHDDPHWIPQERYARLVGFDKLDFVGKTENLEADLAQVSAAVFPGQKYEFQQEARQHKSNAQKNLLNYYTDECEDIVRNLYHQDFSLFGYDDFLKR